MIGGGAVGAWLAIGTAALRRSVRQAVDTAAQAADTAAAQAADTAGAQAADTAGAQAADTGLVGEPVDLIPTWGELVSWAIPLAVVILGTLAGVFFEKFLVRRLILMAQKTDWEWDDILLRSLRRAPTLLFTAVGAWAATQLLPLAGPVTAFLEKALMVLVILSVTLVVARATAAGIQRYASRTGTILPATSLVTNIVKLVVFTLGILLILANLGINITALVTGLGIGGLAVALALQPTLANAFAGFQIIATRQVREGDYVRLESGEEGYVVDVRWRNTTIKALWDDHEVIVPNSKLSDSIVINYNLPARPFWVRIPVGVSYGSDLEHVERVAMEVATEVWKEFTALPRDEDVPVLRFQDFADSAITFSVRILADEFAQQYRLRHEYVKRLHRRFDQEGIVIPWPIRTLHVPDSVPFRMDGGGPPAGKEAGPAERTAREEGGGRPGAAPTQAPGEGRDASP